MIFAKTAPAWLLVRSSARESNPCVFVRHILELLKKPISITSDRVFLSIKTQACSYTKRDGAIVLRIGDKPDFYRKIALLIKDGYF